MLCNLHKLQSELDDPAEQLLIVLKRVHSFGRLCTFHIHIHTMTQSLESQYQLFLRKRNLTIIAAKDSVLLHDGQKQTPDHCLQMQR